MPRLRLGDEQGAVEVEGRGTVPIDEVEDDLPDELVPLRPVLGRRDAAVAAGVRDLQRAARELGSPLDDPMMLLSFLALPVIPALRLTDRGLVDVDRFAIVPLAIE